MKKIPKGLSDQEMFKDCPEAYEEAPARPAASAQTAARSARRDAKQEPEAPPELYLARDAVDALNKLLLALKVELYGRGVVDYRIAVRREGKSIVLTPEASGGEKHR